MTLKIQPLPTDVVHLIAAGEVIDSLAAVVRELAENAIDARASRIVISIWTDQWRVRAVDNGIGMDLADLQQAARPHSTSKIRECRDLWQITSLGFRGEALHSLAQLADLEICSRADQEGWRVSYDRQGQPQQVDPIAIAPGTIVTASNLFGNWLPRRQALPTHAQQLRAIQLVVQHLALCHPQITWQVEQNDRPWFNLWASSSAQQILSQLLRDVQPSDLQEVRLQGGEESLPLAPSLYLLLGLPDRCHRHRPDWIKVAVNGRVVKAPELEQAMIGGLRRILPRDRYPVCFLHLQVAPPQIDWNRHPAKAEIYLRHLDAIETLVIQAIDRALHLGFPTLPDAYASRIGQLIKTAEAQGTYGASEYRTLTPALAEQEAISPPLIPLKAIAQVHSMYILAEHPAGMWLIEQHIAHERVLYERLCDRWQLVALEPPIILPHLLPAQVEQLQRIGLTVELFGEQRWAVRTAPASLAGREDCPEALAELSLGGDLQAALVATACRTAIRNGILLTLDEMQTLLDQWQQTRSPRTCPHGRPIYLPIEESSLARFFRRHWVIGKSHGI